MIKEVIVVEGKDDITAVKAAVECEVIATGGFRFSDKFIERLRFIQKQKGIIVLTDPNLLAILKDFRILIPYV